MLVLAVDTSGSTAGAALARGGQTLFASALQGGRGHAEQVMALVENGCSALGVAPRDIDLFAAVVGPGSFTGVRIGVCCVKGMAEAAGKPCAAVHALEALVAGVSLFDGVICPMLDARASQVYTAAFRRGVRIREDAVEKLDALIESWQGSGDKLLFVGDGAALHEQRLREALGARAHFAPPHLNTIQPAVIAQLALSAPQIPADALLPLYLRAPQAERERLARMSEEAE